MGVGGERVRSVNIVNTLFQILLLCADAVLALMIAYLLLLTIVALFVPRHTKLRPDVPSHRFLILVPAHNEERLLPSLLANLKQLDYPASLYAVHVVAGKFDDRAGGLLRLRRINDVERQWAVWVGVVKHIAFQAAA